MKNSLTESAALPLVSEGEAASVASPGFDPISMIFVKVFKGASRSAETLLAKRRALKNPETVYGNALWDGFWALDQEAIHCAKEAQKRGQLLFLGGRSA